MLRQLEEDFEAEIFKYWQKKERALWEMKFADFVSVLQIEK